jgi:hypothetical protein
MPVTTVQLLADKALQGTAGHQCVDWAIGMLERGYEGNYLLRLAGMLPPYNHFEISDLRDRALNELCIDDVNKDLALQNYATEVLTDAIRGRRSMISAIEIVKELCIANDYQRELMDFYLLYFAYTDLQESDVQWYWPDATRQNINEVVRERAVAFVESQIGDRL